MSVFLSGPMGSGKSTLAPLVASRLGLRAIDLDDVVGAPHGGAGAALEALGEKEFREREEAALREVLREGPAVVALGGGTVTNRALRRALLGEGTVVTLRAGLDELLRRVGDADERPLLRGAPRAHLERLLAERRDDYAEAHAEIDTSGREPAAVVEEIAGAVADAPIVVPLGARTYRAVVGREIRRRAVALVGGRGALVVTDRNAARWAGDVLPGAPVVSLEPGEPQKTLDGVRVIWDRAIALGLDRTSVLVAVGGGVVGDLTGFAASTLYRGVDWIAVPTTLLAMVDAALGGKTAVDLPAGKNLVGTLHHPRAVLVDLVTLETLPVEERIAALAEVVKTAWIEGEPLLSFVEAHAAGLRRGDEAAVAHAVRGCLRAKARIVAADERDDAARRTLNVGHTIGHAIEAALGFGIRHGEAVAMGLAAEARISVEAGILARADEVRLSTLLERLGLPTSAPAGLDLTPFVARDKKAAAGVIAWPLLAGPGQVVFRRR